MKKKWLLGMIAIAVSVLVVIGVILVSAYCSDGIHVLGRNIHARYVQECYLIDNGQVTGTTFVAMDGYSRWGKFEGYLYVDDYPIPMHEAMARNSGGDNSGYTYRIEDGYIDIFYEGLRTVDGEYRSSRYQYLFTLDKNKPDQFVLYIYTDDYSQSLAAAVPAATPEEALGIFNDYIHRRYGSS